MKKIEYKDIEIIYDENDKTNLTKLISYLDNNQSFIKMLLPKKMSFVKGQEAYLYINDIDSFIKKIVKRLLDNESFQKLQRDDSYYDSIYYNILLSRYDDKKCFDKELEDQEENYYFSLIASSYYSELDSFLEFIKDPKDEEKEILLNWLSSNSMISAYNKILQIYINSLGEINIATLNDMIIYLKELLRSTYEDRLKNDSSEDNLSFQELSLNELDVLFKEFLSEIDPSKEWLELYEKAKEEEKIIFHKANISEYDDSSLVKDGVINIYYHSNINDFRVLAHEFVHYISQDLTNPILVEFPSIFYEEEALLFLERYGYSKEEVDKVRKIRRLNTSENYISISRILDHLLMFKKDKEISINSIMKSDSNKLNQNISSLQLTSLLSAIIKDEEFFREKTKEEIDYNTKYLIVGAPYLLDKISYIIGTYLTYIMSQDEDKLNKMKYITDNMVLIEPEDIIGIINNTSKMYYK